MSDDQKSNDDWGIIGLLKRHKITLMACIPQRIDDPRYPHLRGFPVNIAYPAAQVPEDQPNGGSDAPPDDQKHHLFWPVTGTYQENGSTRSLDYHTFGNGPHWVRVVCDEREGLWWVYQYKGREVVRTAKGPSFRGVMYHATLGGLNFADDMERLQEKEKSG